ncbi:hypothetical protein [Staphylococcus hyicus]|uniref:Uncharacterized protein n=2 Tax=Staphylococcus hyicus TaxID=1284 RepID=A0ACD5FPT0_STAHY|nr:hypothetical protein [Staphylococcus hyicus]MCE5154326.1 hypothetical protein [Staphylococcus hyicus]MCQ9291799.1 hypothetical protein [Staphylococcus hyicus]MCQ9300822.1 hypothetical protein [Staphylococcus hyicus]MCQ9307040.1 hypothetical protein [Staphylococcus hyicus]MCQ9309174.1 hypothetical protein [Staphylococcus hyicus]
MKKVFLTYEWVAVILGTIVLVILCLNMAHIIRLELSLKLTFQAFIILTIGLISIRTRKWLGMLTLILGTVLLIVAILNV